MESDEDPRTKLSAEQYEITQNKGTERAFTGKYVDHKEDGTYRCVCCDAELFSSQHQYDSGSGWPSFDDAIDGAVKEVPDADGMRTEIVCANCGGHLGHVFHDGPPPTGQRYCMNSLALRLDRDADPDAPVGEESE